MTRPTFDSHPLEEQLERYSMGTLPETECAPVEEHLLMCSLCQDRLAEADEYVTLMKSATRKLHWAEPGAGRSFFSRFLWSIPKPAWAAGCAVLTVLAAISLESRVSNPEVSISLEAVRGFEGPTVSRAVAGQPIQLSLDLADLPEMALYRVEVVSVAGNREWEGAGQPSHGRLAVHIGERLGAGLHWIRLYSNATLVREYGLRLR